MLDALIMHSLQQRSCNMLWRTTAVGQHLKALVARFSAGMVLVKLRLLGLKGLCEVLYSLALSSFIHLERAILLFKVYTSLIIIRFHFFHFSLPFPLSIHLSVFGIFLTIFILRHIFVFSFHVSPYFCSTYPKCISALQANQPGTCFLKIIEALEEEGPFYVHPSFCYVNPPLCYVLPPFYYVYPIQCTSNHYLYSSYNEEG